MRLRSNHYKSKLQQAHFAQFSYFHWVGSVVNNPGLNFYDHCAFHVYLIGILFSRRISILRGAQLVVLSSNLQGDKDYQMFSYKDTTAALICRKIR
ncbi:hypothetical protein CDAR_403191 [Caerostris darwini]|uniref:Uncharacterized protein n=1 Tax=Caerostris darwini TaxID=1538125 RepID=A0AAV4X173_9ARAC|nr:hypothetical protein CDAR_403191 [Caerostris darwini]